MNSNSELDEIEIKNNTLNMNSDTVGMVHDILDDIIFEIIEEKNYYILDYKKQLFVEKIFTTIVHIIQKNNISESDEKLKSYEYYRYSTITSLLQLFISKLINFHFLDDDVKNKLYVYLEHSYTKSKYYQIIKNIHISFKQRDIIVSNYLTPHVLQFKMLLWGRFVKQCNFLGIIIQNRELLKTINKESLDELFNKIIFELTIYILFFTR